MEQERKEEEALKEQIKIAQEKEKSLAAMLPEVQKKFNELQHLLKQKRSLLEQEKQRKEEELQNVSKGSERFQKYLGLMFDRAEGTNVLSVQFTNIDPADPDKKFSFGLCVNDKKRYEGLFDLIT